LVDTCSWHFVRLALVWLIPARGISCGWHWFG
jgi:hypothetical protein